MENLATHISELAGIAYEAALDSSKWQLFCDRLARVTGARVALHGRDQMSGVTFGVLYGNYDPAFIDSYVQHYGAVSPWMAAVDRTPVGHVQPSEAILPFDELVRSELYNDWLRPQEDIATGSGVTLFRDGSRLFRLSCNIRLRDREAHQAPLMAMLEALVPHMQAVLDLSRQLAGIPVGADLARALDLPHQAIVLVDRLGRVVHANRHAQAMLRHADHLRQDHAGTLVFADSVAGETVRRFLATRDSLGAARKLTLRSTTQLSMTRGSIAPFRDDCEKSPFRDVVFERMPVAILCLELPSLAPGAVQDQLVRRHELTPAEAQVASLIYSGHRPRDVAELRGTSLETVRAQLKAIFLKLSVGSQAELCSALDRLARAPSS